MQSPPKLTPSQKYVLKSLYRSKNVQLSCTGDVFLTSVHAEILILDIKVNIEEFFKKIDRSLETDRSNRERGSTEPSAFKKLPECAVLMKAIRKAIEGQRGTSRPHKELRGHELFDRGPEPCDSASAAERAAAVHRAMKFVTKPRDRTILKLLFFNRHGDGQPVCKNQKEVAEKLKISTSTVSRRLEAIYALLREHIELPILNCPS